MSQPTLPTFPREGADVDVVALRKIARASLVGLRSACAHGSSKREDGEAILGTASLPSQVAEALVSFFNAFWRYLVYHRLGGQALLNALETSLPPPLLDVVAEIWYADGPSVFTDLARRTASNHARVNDISWSVWTQTASDGLPSGDGALGIRLDISTDKGMRTVFLSRSEAAALHDETVRIQAEIDKLLE
ncbi:unnamed protein product [Heligmosomoides polygyrus]|uniref:COMM domain-containing protein n=1 Tax=Heligmosomoides polygyrus TaxID=6339 RepID=A0A183GKH0_HELPZ|nr:unnamed protein product [Heligmosomoides polygyrus]